MQALIALLMVPLMVLNFFGDIVSGIWLAIPLNSVFALASHLAPGSCSCLFSSTSL